MSYDKEFFEKYQNYLHEPTVRNMHDRMFDRFYEICGHDLVDVIDLGCGLCQEYRKHGNFHVYKGVDKIVENGQYTVKADYLTYAIEQRHTVFVSLFSTECCLSAADKYEFYRKKFRENLYIKRGLVSGFYYKNRAEQEKVEEVGGLVSYQTIENQQQYQCKEFIEFRAQVDVPSELFGPDVVEVWKFFIRNR
jgi:hypothetical protein